MGDKTGNGNESELTEESAIDRLYSELARKKLEVRIIEEISAEINTSLELDVILSRMLEALDRAFHFEHSMILLSDEKNEVLQVAAMHGFEYGDMGAEVKFGQGVVGVVAKKKKLMRMGNIGAQMSYMNAVKSQMDREDEALKLPGLPNVESQVAIPLLSKENLIGVLAVESDRPNVFDKKDELIITILANQAANAIVKARAHEDLKHLNAHLEEKVIERTAEVVEQKEIVEEQNAEMLSSFRYAKRFQDIMLPKQSYVDEYLPDSFQLFKPKDIVSGDLYWVNHKQGKTFFGAIDCTGHGVPGAFVSITAHGSLQRAVIMFKDDTPAKVLDRAKENVTDNFNKSDDRITIQDGMDIALCAINPEGTKLEFAGAYNSLYIISDGELKEVKGDKQPIGYSETSYPFTNHELEIKKGDCIYIFSDGYADQFGGPKDKKFMSKRFKNLLLEIHQKPMKEQYDILDKTIEDWKGEVEQTDDICVFGVRV